MSVMEDIKELVAALEQEQQMAPINVELLDNELGIVYANSKKAEVGSDVLFVVIIKYFNLCHTVRLNSSTVFISTKELVICSSCYTSSFTSC